MGEFARHSCMCTLETVREREKGLRRYIEEKAEGTENVWRNLRRESWREETEKIFIKKDVIIIIHCPMLIEPLALVLQTCNM